MFTDANGNEWNTAQEALDEFLSDLPYLTDDQTEEVFQFTSWSATPESNLAAIDYGIVYSGNAYAFNGYPVPYLKKSENNLTPA